MLIVDQVKLLTCLLGTLALISSCGIKPTHVLSHGLDPVMEVNEVKYHVAEYRQLRIEFSLRDRGNRLVLSLLDSVVLIDVHESDLIII